MILNSIQWQQLFLTHGMKEWGVSVRGVLVANVLICKNWKVIKPQLNLEALEVFILPLNNHEFNTCRKLVCVKQKFIDCTF